MEKLEKKVSEVSQMQKKISEELQSIDKNLNNMEELKKSSVEKLESKKLELSKLSNAQSVCDEHYETLKEMNLAQKIIEERKLSITILDTTIANLDMQIAKIQAEHDAAVAQLEAKRRKLNEYLQYYEDLNQKLENLLKMLSAEQLKHCLELNKLKKQRSDLIKRTDLKDDEINKLINELDAEIVKLNKEHADLIESIGKKLSDITIDQLEPDFEIDQPVLKKPYTSDEAIDELTDDERKEKSLEKMIDKELTEEELTEKELAEKELAEKELAAKELAEKELAKKELTEKELTEKELTEKQINELRDYEEGLRKQSGSPVREKVDEHRLSARALTNDERLDILRKGLQITPSNRIITKDDKVLNLAEAEGLGLIGLYGFDGGESFDQLERFPSEGEEEEVESRVGDMIKDVKKESDREYTYESPPTSSSSSRKDSSESILSNKDIDYLKLVFGKSLTLALAEITAVQPLDPIHYLAHWMLKYRYNQEIDEVRRIQIQELMIEQERIAAAKWHCELQEEAKLAVLEALFRAENIIIQHDFQSHFMEEFEGEYGMDNTMNNMV